VEHAGFLSLLDVIAFFDSDVAGADFIHADTNEAHQADVRVIRLDEDDGSV